MADCEWKLLYWHVLPGRGDFVRLMFEDAGVKYDDVCRRENSSAEALKYYKGEKGSYPINAPPIIVRGDFVMNQTPAIMFYLGKEFGMYPTGGPEEEAHAMQINVTVADYMSEGHDCFHPMKKTGSYDSQKEEAKPFIEAFKTDRMPKYLSVFERALTANNNGDGFFFGDKVTYADIAVYQALRATEFQFPERYAELPIPKLREFKKRMDERPRIKEYLASPRCKPFCGNSMM